MPPYNAPVPFELFGHRDRPASVPGSPPGEPAVSAAPGGAGTAGIEAFTPDARIVGRVRIEGRLSDALNRRVPIPVDDVRRGPLDAADLPADPDLHELDPYELVVVAAGPDSQPDLAPERRAALRVRKERYGVCCEVDGGRVYGTVHLHPGTDPAELLGRRPDLFVAVTDADVCLGPASPCDAALDVAFVNVTYLRRIVPIDETGVAVGDATASDADAGTDRAS